MQPFEIRSEFEMIQNTKNGDNTRSFFVTSGFYYSADDNYYDKLPVFYFSINNLLDSNEIYFDKLKKSYFEKSIICEPNNNYKFYSEIKAKNKNDKIKIIISHPDNPRNYDDKFPEEGITIFCHEPNMSLIDEMFELYKESILLPFLRNLKINTTPKSNSLITRKKQKT